MPSHEAMTALMAPRSVAVVGATERADASTSFVLRNLLAHGFRGSILPVNPRGGTVMGRPVAPSLADLDETPDVAVIGIAAVHVNAALEQAAARGVKAAVVLASGFAEANEEGRLRQGALADIARTSGMAVCGPNCLGLVNFHSGAALFSSTLSSNMARGGVALVSHSGASAIALANTGRIGLSHVVSAGNGAAADLPDYTRWLAQDSRTHVMTIVLEAIRDPAAFMLAADAAHKAEKPVIVLRVGRSAIGERATAAHTGALAGSNEAYASFFRRAGVVSVSDFDELVQAAVLFSRTERKPLRRGVAVIGVSGGGVAHVADIAEEVGLELATFSPQTVAHLTSLLPAFTTPQNPLDTTGAVFADAGLYRRVLETVASDPAVGVIVAAQDAPPGLDEAAVGEYLGIAGAVRDFATTSHIPTVLLSNLGAGHHPAFREVAQEVTLLNGTRPALAAVKALTSERGAAPTLEPRRTGFGPLNAQMAKAWLGDHGVAGPREAVARSAEEAAAQAALIGFPVALKVVSPDLPHKTEAGGVRLGITSPSEARSAYDAILASARTFAPHAALERVLVQEMVTGGVEVLLGITRHDPFGLGLVIGSGGTLVELLGDAAFELLPIDETLVRPMLGRTRLARLLAGYRGAPPADTEALVNAAVSLSEFALTHAGWIEAIELNPIAVLPAGQGVRLLDLLLITRRAGS